MTRLIIALTGEARAGKDTVADRLVSKHGFTRIALADEVRRAALAIDPWITIDEQERRTHGLTTGPLPVRLSAVVDMLGWDEAKKIREVRRTLQRVGTEGGWQIHGEDLWTTLADRKIAALDEITPVVITDARMPHEQPWIDEIHAVGVKIIRPDNPHRLQGEAARHLSEQGGIRTDHTLLNDTTIDELDLRVDALVAQLHTQKKET